MTNGWRALVSQGLRPGACSTAPGAGTFPRVRDGRYRRVARGYLTDDSLGPVPLVRLAERDHGKANQVFQRVTNNATFCWPQDGESLLRRHKPLWYARPQLPRIVVLNQQLSPHLAVS